MSTRKESDGTDGTETAWRFRARGAEPVARVPRATFGYRPTRSSAWRSFGARPSSSSPRDSCGGCGDRYSLIEKPGGDCIFWDKHAGCTVYPARPVQCQTWPFWPENVETQEDWDQVREICPGSGQGRLYTVDEIVSSISKTPE